MEYGENDFSSHHMDSATVHRQKDHETSRDGDGMPGHSCKDPKMKGNKSYSRGLACNQDHRDSAGLPI